MQIAIEGTVGDSRKAAKIAKGAKIAKISVQPIQHGTTPNHSLEFWI